MEDVIVELEFTYVRSNIILSQLLDANNISRGVILAKGNPSFLFTP